MKNMVILVLSLLASCGAPEYSPWQTNVEHNDLTAKHLAQLYSQEVNDSFNVAVIGDPQAVIGHMRRVIDITNASNDIDFIAVLGDMTDLGLRREWIWLGDTIDRSNKPVLTVVGNHDGLSNGSDIYKDMFGPLNYSFVYRDIKFIMWNNNLYEWGRPDFEWLTAEVDSHDRVIVMSHQPPYSGTLSNDMEDLWKSIRMSPNVIASVHGHVHSYNFSTSEGKPIYTVDRVTGSHYGIVHIGADGSVSVSNCTPVCEVIE